MRLSCCEGRLCRWGEVGRPGAPSSTASRSSGDSTPRWQATTSTCLQVDRVGEVLVGRAEELWRSPGILYQWYKKRSMK